MKDVIKNIIKLRNYSNNVEARQAYDNVLSMFKDIENATKTSCKKANNFLISYSMLLICNCNDCKSAIYHIYWHVKHTRGKTHE